MKKIISLLLMLMLSAFCTIGMAGCTYDDYDDDYSSDSSYDSSYDSDYSGESTGGTSLEDYDYNNNGEIETHEFQDATNDYMDENGY